MDRPTPSMNRAAPRWREELVSEEAAMQKLVSSALGNETLNVKSSAQVGEVIARLLPAEDLELPGVHRIQSPREIQVSGVSYLEPGTLYQVPSTWYQPPSTWYQVLGVWHQVPGILKDPGFQDP